MFRGFCGLEKSLLSKNDSLCALKHILTKFYENLSLYVLNTFRRSHTMKIQTHLHKYFQIFFNRYEKEESFTFNLINEKHIIHFHPFQSPTFSNTCSNTTSCPTITKQNQTHFDNFSYLIRK